MAARENTEASALVLIRFVIGAVFLTEGLSIVRAGVDASLVTDAEESIRAAPGPFAWWGENVLLALPGLFAALYAYGQVAFGIAFIVGALVRPTGVLAAVLLLHVYLGGSDERRQLALVLAACCIALAWARAGRTLGMDSWLDDALPEWLTWSDSKRRRLF